MKLKKIASLALAGVMAVSMLAGCNSVSNNPPAHPSQFWRWEHCDRWQVFRL